MPMLNLPGEAIEICHSHATEISNVTHDSVAQISTKSIERSLLRLLGLNTSDQDGVPSANIVVDVLERQQVLSDGVCASIERVAAHESVSWRAAIDRILKQTVDVRALPTVPVSQTRERARLIFADTIRSLRAAHAHRRHARDQMKKSGRTLRYVLTATGSAVEDVVHARAVANAGGDIVAVIRSTAQSLLDYVPDGLTTEGYGGTYATQENFRHIRRAMDEWSTENGRYIQVSSFCSGLCMPEIAVLGAIEGFDNMVNDALYGVLYRDINPVRTIADQFMSRAVNGCFDITINTGEDNYLRTADPFVEAPSVVASQFINYHLARRSGLTDDQIGIGNACEIAPETVNGLLYEWAQALLTRQLFPNCPTKYMPPTKHMTGDLFRTHSCDTFFNLVTAATRQGIQTIGVPTEGVFTPLIQDRVNGLNGANLVSVYARDLHKEVVFPTDGLVQTHARRVLDEATRILGGVASKGLFKAIEEGTFGSVSRAKTGGRGADGVIQKSDAYVNGFLEAFHAEARRIDDQPREQVG